MKDWGSLKDKKSGWKVGSPKRRSSDDSDSCCLPSYHKVPLYSPIRRDVNRITDRFTPGIWRSILEFATDTLPAPYSIHDLSIPTVSSSIPISEAAFHRLHRQSMHIKCQLSYVCRLWMHITREFRFESVWLTSPQQALALGKLITKQEASGLTGAKSCAWWIRKIHIDTSRHTTAISVLDHNYWYKGEPFISQCPRLLHYTHTIYKAWKAAVIPTTLLPELLPSDSPKPESTTPTRLSRFFASSPPAKPSPQEKPVLTSLTWTDVYPYNLYTYLQDNASHMTISLASLQHLTLRSTVDDHPYRTMLASKSGSLTLPGLRSLRVDDVRWLNQPTEWSLPDLRSLSIMGSVRSVAHEQTITSFLTAHGRKLEELELTADFSFHDPMRYIKFDELCPVLATLQISARLPWPSFVKKQTSLRRLSVLDLEAIVKHAGSNELFKRIREVARDLDQLDVFQDNSLETERLRLDAEESMEKEESRAIVDFYEAVGTILGEAGIAFLDWSGTPIPISGAYEEQLPTYGKPQ